MGSGCRIKKKPLYVNAMHRVKATKEELLAAESAAYHSAGTCTFYGTANSNQMLLEAMACICQARLSYIKRPFASCLTDAAVEQVLKLTETAGDYRPIGQLVNEKTIVNAVIAVGDWRFDQSYDPLDFCCTCRRYFDRLAGF